jgi:multimeric flavodoxin WrbA
MDHILGIVGSPRTGGNTEQLMERLLAAARKEGAETLLFPIAGKEIAPCRACDGCIRGEAEYCVQDDDMLDLYPRIVWADAIVFGTPVYMGTMSAQLKAVFDRTRPLWRMDNLLSRKVAAAIAVGDGQWGGQELAVQNIYYAALNHGMVVVGPATIPHGGWEVCGVAAGVGGIKRDRAALKAAEGLGRRLAQMDLSVE